MNSPAAICGPHCQPHDVQADVGAAAFVRDRKAVTRQTDFAAADQTNANHAYACHPDGAVGAAVRAETGGHAVTDEDDGRKGMRELVERGLRAAAAEAC